MPQEPDRRAQSLSTEERLDSPLPVIAGSPLDVLAVQASWDALCRSAARGLTHLLNNTRQALIPPALPEGTELSQTIEWMLGRLESAAGVLARMGRPREARPRPTLVPEVFEELEAWQASQSGLPRNPMEYDLGPDLPAVGLGAGDLLHVLLALVTNAKEASEGEPKPIRISARPHSSGVLIEVCDSAAGIPEADRERVLEPFVGYREGHLGVGLPAVRCLLRETGGRLTLGPGPGGCGTTVSVFLPAWKRPAAADA
ncbi:MAG: ATP-binding protein [Gemmatimonadales bacterium]